jgi:4-oxalocrotonate tautomerase
VSGEAKARIIKGITKVFEELGIPGHAVEVVILEVPKENWGIGENKPARNSRRLSHRSLSFVSRVLWVLEPLVALSH